MKVFTRSQKKEAFSKLAPTTKDFIMSNEVTEIIEKLLENAKLSDKQNIDADAQILYAMYGLQTLSQAINNIAEICGKNIEYFSKLKNDLGRDIFSKISNELNEVEQQMNEKEEDIEQENIGSDSIGQSFEKIILNQAKAMQPAKPAAAPTGGSMNYEVRSMEKKKEEQPKIVHNYAQGNDPYREPLQ